MMKDNMKGFLIFLGSILIGSYFIISGLPLPSKNSNTRMRDKDLTLKKYPRETEINKIKVLKRWSGILRKSGIKTIGDLSDFINSRGYSGLLDLPGLGEITKQKIYKFYRNNL